MKYIAAYMMAKLGGKENPTVEDINMIIESVGIEFEYQKAKGIVDKLEGKDFNEVMKDGKSKLSNVSNSQTTENEEKEENEGKQQPTKEEKTNIRQEEETIEIEGGFDDLFN